MKIDKLNEINNNPKRRFAVLISGRGTNMMALVTAQYSKDFPAEIAVVISNKEDAPGLQWAREHSISTCVVDHRKYPDRLAFDHALDEEISRYNVDIVCLAGFMRILTPWFVDKWIGNLINIHPSLLPHFPGRNTHKRVLESGHERHGCTVHFVTLALDAGPIVAQASVPILISDTEETLAQRILDIENHLYPLALSYVAKGEARYQNGETIWALPQSQAPKFPQNLMD